MGFKEVIDLDCERTTALGGKDKKSGKANPTQAEGYYIGSKDVASPKSKTGFSKLHYFRTSKGTLGVWGKTDLDRKLLNAPVGAMVRATFTGMVPTSNGDMYKFRVEVDAENTIEVNLPQSAATEEEEDTGGGNYADAEETEDETSVDDDAAPVDEAPPARSQPPRQAARTPDAARQSKVQELLATSRGKRI